MKVCLCYIIICMKVCLCYIIYLYVCTNEDVYHCTYTCMQTCCWLLVVQVLGRCHALSHTFCNLFTLQLTCEKDVGMGLCTFNFVLRLSLHLVCLLHPYIKIFLKFFLLTCLYDFFGCHSIIV